MRIETKKFLSIAAAASAMFIGGCACSNDEGWQKDASGGYQDPFFPASDKHIHDIAAHGQVVAGARGSATLHDMHFTGDRLNSLGHDKLLLVFENHDSGNSSVVYLDTTGSDDEFAARSEAVRMFAESLGMNDGDLRLEKGANPGMRTATAPLLRNLPKTDSSPDASAAVGK